MLGIEQPPRRSCFHQTAGTVHNHDIAGYDEFVGDGQPVDGGRFDVDGHEHHRTNHIDNSLDDERDRNDRNDDLHLYIELDVGVDQRVDVVHRLMSIGPAPSILFLCTGNASRSVMAAAALTRRRPELPVATAGTLVLEGLPMSTRTRQAMLEAGVTPSEHRSRQATATMLAESSLVIAAAPEHVAWVRREHPGHIARTATLIHLVRNLSTAPSPLTKRVTELGLDAHVPGPDEEIIDPGGGELGLYVQVARQIVSLIDDLAARL